MKQLPTSVQSIDEKYQKAIFSGNKVLGEEIALEYASSQGFSVPAFHGTYKDFNMFVPGDIGIHFSRSKDIAINRLNDTEWENYSSEKHPHGTIHHVALRIENPYYIHSDLDDWKPGTFFRTAYFKSTLLKGKGVPFESPTAMYIGEQKKIASDAYRFLKKIGYTDENVLLIASQFAESRKDEDEYAKLNSFYTTEFRRRLKSLNIDAILYDNDFESYEGDDSLCYIILNSNNIKSIEPVYLNNDLLPLTKRFQFSSPFFRE